MLYKFILELINFLTEHLDKLWCGITKTFKYTLFCVYGMVDIFDNTILCKRCNSRMKKAQLAKNGFILRAVVCPKCNEKIIHPVDEDKYNKFRDLKSKEFHVKMRMVGNSYAVSIPKEIVSFMKMHEKLMDDMVKLCFEDTGRVSLNFHEVEND